MILDNASSHFVSSAKVGKLVVFQHWNMSNMTFVFLPPNVTSVIQPLDQGIIASFKNSIQEETFVVGFTTI